MSCIFRSSGRIKHLFFAICLIVSFAGSTQETPIEDELFSCIRFSFSGNSQMLDSLITTFESELIDEGLLESRGAEDYRGLLQRIASEQPILRGMDSYFFTRFRNMAPDSMAILTCLETMDRYAVRFPEDLLGRTLNLRQESMTERIPPSTQAAAFLEILEGVDFEIPLYRFLTYHIIDGQAYETAITTPSLDDLRNRGLMNVNGANVFRVLMNEANQLISGDQLISFDQLLTLVQMHARRFEDRAVYIVEVEEDVKYTSFITLQDQIALAITQVRDDYARRYLGKTLTELTQEEQEAVFYKFPIQIVSP
ncbi:MAG: hypothetical protein P8X60_03555 [Robiginitalea sp.]